MSDASIIYKLDRLQQTNDEMTIVDTYFKNHLSLSEWAARSEAPQAAALLAEDASKRERLATLHRVIRLPIVEAAVFTRDDVYLPSARFAAFRTQAGSKLYAVRATPREPGPPILRNRGVSVEALTQWLVDSAADLSSYDVSFEPHIEPAMAAIFIVAADRVFGEAAPGGILRLNKGAHANQDVIYFEYDFGEWSSSEDTPHVLRFVRDAVHHLQVPDEATRQRLRTELKGEFIHDHLAGYFEAIQSGAGEIFFIDYNRLLSRTVNDLRLAVSTGEATQYLLKGQIGCRGLARGIARVIEEKAVSTAHFDEGDILVCRFTSPDYIPLITKAAAVVTDIGGVLSHAAIVCRELRKPCVIGTGRATSRITTGERIEVNANEGVVTPL